MVVRRSGGIIARRHAEWSERLERLKASGLAVGVFAAQEGVRPATLSWWRRRLSTVAVTASRPSERTTALSFVRLEAPPVSSASLEVIVATGRTIRIPAGFDEETLSRVVVVLERGIS